MRHGDYSPDEERLIYDSSVSDVVSIVSDAADNGEATMSSELVFLAEHEDSNGSK